MLRIFVDFNERATAICSSAVMALHLARNLRGLDRVAFLQNVRQPIELAAQSRVLAPCATDTDRVFAYVDLPNRTLHLGPRVPRLRRSCRR